MTRERTRLLVSVHSAGEAAVALAGGADVIDVKEPAHGPLGAAEWSTIVAVVECVAGLAPVSAALGELLDWTGDIAPDIAGDGAPASNGAAARDDAIAGDGVRRLAFVKFGLAGCAGKPAQWRHRWRQAIESFPPGIECVPVAYADAESADSPSLVATIDWAAENGCSFLLIDTHEKDGRNLTHYCDERVLGELLHRAHHRGLRLGLAGSLADAALARVIALGPDLVGVRGAACRGGRLGNVDESLVRLLVAQVAGGQPV